jgi:signal transduction histidine kinase
MTFRVRAVRIGVVATALAIVSVAVLPLIPGHPGIDIAPFAVLLVIASLGAGGVAALPWRRLLERRAGDYVFYTWSAADIVIIGLAAAASGGGRSPVVLLYFATTLFFVSSYPLRGQIGLLVLTYAAWLLLIAFTGESPGGGVVLVQLASLGVVAFLGSFLSSQLVQQMAALGSARGDSEHRAMLLGAVASAATSINVLDPEQVLARVVDAVTAIGFDAANLCVFEEDGKTFTIVQGRGLPPEYEQGVHPADIGMPGLVREHNATVVVNDYAADPRGVPTLREAGFRSVMAAPIWHLGELAAVLVGGSRQRRTIASEEVEAFELLARQAEVALANVRRYEDERETVKRLGELDRLKRDFLANVSHELRTPLTVIQGMGKTLASRWQDMEDGTRHELLGRLSRNADTLADTINTLLDFSQLEAGRLEARPQVFDLSDLVHRSVERLGSLFGARRIELAIDDGVHVDGDPRLIERVVDNLVSNAAKHTPETSAVVISTCANGSEAVVTVSDDGPGIAASDLEHLGERFFRGSEVVARRTRGAGLGLAFAREVMELHGRTLDIESRAGGGSTFSFSLPLAVAPIDGSDGPV